MLEIKNLTKIFANRPILRNLSLTVEDGEVLAIIGPNGAGKSTFLKCIAGLLKPTSGEIVLDGKTIKKDSFYVKKKLGFLGHESFLYNHLTPVENLRFYGKLYKVKNLEDRVDVLLKKVDLYLFRDTQIRSFSRGMLQRLAIARVLLSDPDILMLDEPHTGLDHDAIELLNRIILEKKQGGTSILLITHQLEQVQALADRAALLKKGKLVGTVGLDSKWDIEELTSWYEKAVSG